MLKIGQFSKVCNVSVQTLRYYDKIGLLPADYIDDASGYRYYDPEKVKTYQIIEQLKKLDFSLDEIKLFLSASYTEQCRIYQNKKGIILDAIQTKREQVKKIDDLCENPKVGLKALNDQILNIPFENDPKAIGRWVYCGNLSSSDKFKGEDYLVKREVLQKSLYFLPGGGHVWMYFWTKGVLYCTLHEFNVIVPNRYCIFKFNNETYMKIDWMTGSFVNSMSDDNVRVYRQADTHEYSEQETYNYRDEVDLPYTADDRVIGEWETVDMISDISEFSSEPSKWNKCQFWIAGLKFYERGVCCKTYNNDGIKYDKGFKYTAGVLIDEQQECAQRYQILCDNNVDYLILEHKSADYSYTGKVFCYYVFRRKI